MLFKQILTSGLFKLLIQIITFLTTILIARKLGSEVLGEFNLAISFIAIFNVFFVNSISSANISIINRDKVSDSVAVSTFIALSALIFIAYGFFLLLFSYINYYNYNRDLFLVIVFLYLSAIERCGVEFRY